MSTLELRVEEPVTFVISGASGDLTRRKLIPALYTLFKEGALTGDKALKAKTNENMDAVGNLQAIEANAVVLLQGER